MSDEDEIYAANTADEASSLYEIDTGLKPEHPYPIEVSDVELDRPRAEHDEDERPTGKRSSIRQWLHDAVDPGFIAGGI